MADPTPAEKAAADKAAEDKKAAEANEKQLLADQKAAAEELAKTPVVVVGRAGGAFSIDGPGLGSSGILTIGGRQVVTTRWDDRSVRGILPAGIKGDVVLSNAAGTRKGVFPTPPPKEVTTTTTVTKL